MKIAVEFLYYVKKIETQAKNGFLIKKNVYSFIRTWDCKPHGFSTLISKLYVPNRIKNIKIISH